MNRSNLKKHADKLLLVAAILAGGGYLVWHRSQTVEVSITPFFASSQVRIAPAPHEWSKVILPSDSAPLPQDLEWEAVVPGETTRIKKGHYYFLMASSEKIRSGIVDLTKSGTVVLK